MAEAVMEYDVSRNARIFRILFRPIFRGIFHMLSKVCIYGLENIPSRGAYLIAINHISIFEPPLILSFWPVAPEAVGAVEIWERRGQSTLARYYGGIPVHRGEYDRQLIDTMISVLDSGRPLLIAPEGGRSHTPGMRAALPGVAYILHRSKAPVIPVGIVGTTEDFLKRALRGERRTLEMHIGKPLWLPEVTVRGTERRIAFQRNADLIMYHIASLLPPEYRGVYATSNVDPTQTPERSYSF